MKIIVTDLSMRGREHIFFNSAMIKMLKLINIGEIHIYADKNHCYYLQEEIGNNYKFHNIKILSHRLWRILFSDIYSGVQALKILLSTSKDDYVVILNRLPITLFLYNLFNLFYQRKTISVIHGEAESIVNFKNVIGITKYYYQLFRLGYRISNKNLVYISLGESIQQQLNHINFGNSRVYSIHHPYDYSVSYDINCDMQNLTFGIIGSALQRKNSQYIFELASKYYESKGHIPEHKIKFTIAGSVDKYISNFINDFVEYNKTTIMYSNDEYAKKISSIHYSLQFYDKTTNIALASGSFFDSFKFEKPIFAIKGNPFIDYYFNLFGNIGFQFDSIDDMVEFLLVHDFSIDEYVQQVDNLKAAKEELKLENIAFDLKKILNT